MRNKNKLQITLSLFAALLLSAVAIAGQDELGKSLVNDNEVLVKVDFKVTDQASKSNDLSGVKRQMVAQYDDWQEVEVNKHIVKYKVSQLQSDESPKLFMIEAHILNSDEKLLHSPSLMVHADTVATIEVSGKANKEPGFNLGFVLVSK